MPDTGEFESMLIWGVGAGMWDLGGAPLPFWSSDWGSEASRLGCEVYSECCERALLQC